MFPVRIMKADNNSEIIVNHIRSIWYIISKNSLHGRRPKLWCILIYIFVVILHKQSEFFHRKCKCLLPNHKVILLITISRSIYILYINLSKLRCMCLSRPTIRSLSFCKSTFNFLSQSIFTHKLSLILYGRLKAISLSFSKVYAHNYEILLMINYFFFNYNYRQTISNSITNFGNGDLTNYFWNTILHCLLMSQNEQRKCLSIL